MNQLNMIVRDAVQGVMANPTRNIMDACNECQLGDLETDDNEYQVVHLKIDDLFYWLRTIYLNAGTFFVNMTKGDVYDIHGTKISERVEVIKLLTTLNGNMGEVVGKVREIGNSQLKIKDALDLIDGYRAMYQCIIDAKESLMKGEHPGQRSRNKLDQIGKTIAQKLEQLEKPKTKGDMKESAC